MEQVGEDQEVINDVLVDQVFASIVETAERKGVSSRALLRKLQDRIQKELDQTEEPNTKRRKQSEEKVPFGATQEQKSFDVFLSHGLKYLPNEHLFPSFCLLSSICKHAAERELTIRCAEQHPSLLAAITNRGDNREALVSVAEWRRFELDEETSRQSRSNAWPSQVSDAIDDIEVLFEASKGDIVIWHSVAPLQEFPGFIGHHRSLTALGATFRVPHWSFEAPLPTATDSFFGPNAHRVGNTGYYFWSGRSDCSLEQKTLCKALYGADSPHLSQTMPPLHVRIVLRRRSNGQMVTIISNTEPSQILGEDYREPIGSYNVDYQSKTRLSMHDRLYVDIGFGLECTPLAKRDEVVDSITFSTNDPSDPMDHLDLQVHFDLEDRDDEDSITEVVLAAMRQWFKE